MDDKKIAFESVGTAKEIARSAPEIKGVRTGVEGLDEMFFTTKLDENGEVLIKPLGGYPSGGVIHITGVPDTGKSLMAEQFLITQASEGINVCLVTVEQPAPFYVASLKQRAAALGVNWEKIEDRIVVIDAATNSDLRNELQVLFDTLAYGIKTYNVKATVVDSVTGLYEAKEMMARQTVRALYNFIKKWHQTSIFISQKRSGHEELTAEAAGGYGVGHIVDATIVVAKKEILSRYDQSLFGAEIGDLIRTIRIDGCRLSGHDTKTRVMEITKSGIVRVGPPLAEVVRKSGKK